MPFILRYSRIDGCLNHIFIKVIRKRNSASRAGKTAQIADSRSRRQWLTNCPDSAEAHFNLALLLVHQDRYPEAEIEYRHVLQIRPDAAEAHRNLGNVLEVLESDRWRGEEWADTVKRVARSLRDWAAQQTAGL